MSTAPISRGPMKASSSSAPSSSGLALWKKAGSGAKPSYDVNPIAIAPGRAGLAASVAAAKIRLPTEKLKKRHRQWLYVLVANFFMDAWAMVYFSYMGFYMHEDSVDLDPMAFRLAFGVLAILLGLKQLQLLTGNMEYVAVWVMLASFMIIGHFYGSVRNYLWLYGQEFPCFLGDQSDTQHGMCTRGEVLIGTVTAVLFMIYSAYMLVLYRAHITEYRQRMGKMKKAPTLDELLESIEDAEDKYGYAR